MDETNKTFTLTAEEVEVVKKALKLANEFAEPLMEALELDISETNIPITNNLLTRIKQWQDENGYDDE